MGNITVGRKITFISSETLKEKTGYDIHVIPRLKLNKSLKNQLFCTKDPKCDLYPEHLNRLICKIEDREYSYSDKIEDYEKCDYVF